MSRAELTVVICRPHAHLSLVVANFYLLPFHYLYEFPKTDLRCFERAVEFSCGLYTPRRLGYPHSCLWWRQSGQAVSGTSPELCRNGCSLWRSTRSTLSEKCIWCRRGRAWQECSLFKAGELLACLCGQLTPFHDIYLRLSTAASFDKLITVPRLWVSIDALCWIVVVIFFNIGECFVLLIPALTSFVVNNAGMRLSWLHQVFWCTFHKFSWRSGDIGELCMYAWRRQWYTVEASGLADWYDWSSAITKTYSLLFLHCCELWIWIFLAFLSGF